MGDRVSSVWSVDSRTYGLIWSASPCNTMMRLGNKTVNSFFYLESSFLTFGVITCHLVTPRDTS